MKECDNFQDFLSMFKTTKLHIGMDNRHHQPNLPTFGHKSLSFHRRY